MTQGARHERILETVRRRGYAAIDELVADFGLTPQTLRRDVQELAARGLLRRHHGGASSLASAVNTPYSLRHVEQAAEKRRIAAAALALVEPGSSLFLTPGTTVEAFAGALAASDLADIRVVTNSTAAAAILGANPRIGVTVTGGTWQANNHALAGAQAAEMAARYRCDLALIGIGAIDPDGWLLEFREEEVAVAKAMLANARRRIVLADHTKFARAAACKLAPVASMTALVTDRPPARAFRRLIQEGGGSLVVAA